MVGAHEGEGRFAQTSKNAKKHQKDIRIHRAKYLTQLQVFKDTFHHFIDDKKYKINAK